MAAAKTAITVAPAPAPPISRPAITTGSVGPNPASTEPAARVTTPATRTWKGLDRARAPSATYIGSTSIPRSSPSRRPSGVGFDSSPGASLDGIVCGIIASSHVWW